MALLYDFISGSACRGWWNKYSATGDYHSKTLHLWKDINLQTPVICVFFSPKYIRSDKYDMADTCGRWTHLIPIHFIMNKGPISQWIKDQYPNIGGYPKFKWFIIYEGLSVIKCLKIIWGLRDQKQINRQLGNYIPYKNYVCNSSAKLYISASEAKVSIYNIAV